MLPKYSVSTPLPEQLGNSRHKVKNQTSSIYQGVGSASGYMGSMNNSSLWTSDNRYTDHISDSRSSSSHACPSISTYIWEEVPPSFLDSIQIPKGTSSSPAPFGAETTDKSDSKAYSVDGLGSSFTQQPGSSSVPSAH